MDKKSHLGIEWYIVAGYSATFSIAGLGRQNILRNLSLHYLMFEARARARARAS